MPTQIARMIRSRPCWRTCCNVLFFLCLLGAPATIRGADTPTMSFDVPGGEASVTLKELAKQAGLEILYSVEAVRGVQTAPVKGDFTPLEAVRASLRATGLVVKQDEKSGAFAVNRAADPNAPRASQESDSRFWYGEVLQLEELEVTAIGQNYVNQDAIQSKRTYAQIYDSISQDDIGKLPDVNIADSFRRIPGISVVNDEDEGRFVLARGIHPSLNHVTIEGMAVATHGAFGGGARNVNLETIPASAVRRLEAFKTFTPNMDGGSIGAYLNLITRSASDRKGIYAVAGTSLGYYSQRDVPTRDHPISTRAQIAYGQKFGKNDRFGLMISVEDLQRSRDQVKIIQDGYSYFNAAGASTGTPLNGNGYAAPNNFRWYVYNNEMNRTGINAKLEFNPTARFSSYLSLYRFRQQDDEDRHGHQIISLTGMSGQTATSGTYASGRSEVSFTHNDIRRRLDGVHYHAEFTPGYLHRITVDAAYSETRYLNSTPFIGFRTPASALLGLTYDSSALIQSYQFNNGGAAAFLGNPANYTLDNFNHRELKTEEYVQNHRITYGFNRQGEQGPWGFEMGADFKRLDRRVNNDRYNWRNTSFRLSSANRTLAYTPPGRIEPYLFLDEVRFGELFINGSGTGFTLTQPSSFEQSAEGDFKYVEDITATYLMGTYQTKRFRAIGGIRYEDVQATAKTFRRLVAPVPDQFLPIDVPTGYDNLLPSGTASYELTTRLWLRAGLSKSVGRPDPSDISTLERVSADGLTITRGNPGLKPREATNYDLSLEYYFPKGEGIIAVAIFRKEITNDIFDLRTTEDINGTMVTVTQPTNAASSNIQGLEFSLVRKHLPLLRDFLPGLGFTGNVTLYDTQFNYVDAAGVRYRSDRMPLQSNWSMNAALAYDWNNRAEVRIAYDYRDEYTAGINPTSPWNNDGWAGFGQWDFTARYRATKRLHVHFSIRNLGNEHRVHLRGLDLGKLHEDVDSGSSYWLGVSYRH